MRSVAIPIEEPARLEALASLDALDTPPDQTLDALVRTAAAVIGCPVSAISLVDESRQWFKASFGLEQRETSRDIALCAHAILQDGLFEVPDCQQDRRFADNPLVTGSPPVRFYASVPIKIDGQNVGTFCVIDHVPRVLDASQRAILLDLSRVAQHWFESWRQQKLLAESVALGNTLFQNPLSGLILIDHAFQIRDANAQALSMLRYERRQLIGRPLTTVLSDHGHLRQGTNSICPAHSLRECTMVRRDGFRFPAETYSLAVNRGFLVVVRDLTERHARERLLRQQSLAIDQSFSGVLMCELDGTIVYANKAALKMTGYSRSELIGSNQRMLESPDVPAEEYESFRELVRSGRRYSGKIVSRRKDGSDFLHVARIWPTVRPQTCSWSPRT
jgi:PAS domain S-box-containing protein